MKYPKIRELWEATRAAVKGPYTSDFPVKEHVPPANFRGKPEFHPDDCVGCLACERVCPVDAIQHEDRTGNGSLPLRVMIHYTDTCIFCGQCEAACITEGKGIRLGKEWELSFFDRGEACETVEKPLQLCEVCGEVIGCKAHLEWLADRLGARAYSSPTLFLPISRRLGLASELLVPFKREGGRADRFKILCSRCRRKTTFTDEQV